MAGGVDIPIIHRLPVTAPDGVRCKDHPLHPGTIPAGSGPSRVHGNASLCPQPRNSPRRSRTRVHPHSRTRVNVDTRGGQ